jgi:hypothetical protein
MTALTPIYGLEYLVQGEPARNTRQALENNAKTIEAALLARGVPPADLLDLIAAGWFTDTGWVNLPLAAGWNSSSSPGYRKIGKTVWFRGEVWTTATSTTDTNLLSTPLPAGFRPATRTRFLIGSTGGSSGVQDQNVMSLNIGTDGVMSGASSRTSSPGFMLGSINYPVT